MTHFQPVNIFVAIILSFLIVGCSNGQSTSNEPSEEITGYYFSQDSNLYCSYDFLFQVLLLDSFVIYFDTTYQNSLKDDSEFLNGKRAIELLGASWEDMGITIGVNVVSVAKAAEGLRIMAKKDKSINPILNSWIVFDKDPDSYKTNLSTGFKRIFKSPTNIKFSRTEICSAKALTSEVEYVQTFEDEIVLDYIYRTSSIYVNDHIITYYMHIPKFVREENPQFYDRIYFDSFCPLSTSLSFKNGRMTKCIGGQWHNKCMTDK
jgi:hypothetical protein